MDAQRDATSRLPGWGLRAFATLTLGFMVLVILEGAVVRATSSGGGCGNHWPLCNGDFVPHHPRLATIIEFTHRSMTGVCTALVAGLIAWTFAAKAKLHPARRTAVWSGILLITEGALGAVLVKGGYVEGNTSDMRVFVQCVHFTNTMLLLAALALTWWRLRETPAAPMKEWRGVAWLAIAATMVTGATGSVAALADTLFPSPTLSAALAQDFNAHAPLLIRMRWMHPAAACLSIVCVLWLAMKLRGTAARWLIALTALQFLLGHGDVLLLAPIAMQVLHLLGADLYWIALVVIAADIVANRKSADSVAETSNQALYASS